MSGCLEGGSAAMSLFKLADATSIGQMPPADPSNTEVADGTRSYEVLPVSSVSEQGINRETLASHVGSRVEVTVRPMEAPTTPSTATTHVDHNYGKGRAIHCAPVHGGQDQ